jgi:hypothetical protein
MDWLELRITICACRAALHHTRRPQSVNQRNLLKGPNQTLEEPS